jgi:hypothetical protein
MAKSNISHAHVQVKASNLPTLSSIARQRARALRRLSVDLGRHDSTDPHGDARIARAFAALQREWRCVPEYDMLCPCPASPNGWVEVREDFEIHPAFVERMTAAEVLAHPGVRTASVEMVELAESPEA